MRQSLQRRRRRNEPAVESDMTARASTAGSGAISRAWRMAHSKKLLRTGQVRLDGKRAKAGDRIFTGQIIRLPPQVQIIHEAVDARSTNSQPVPRQA